MSSLARTLAERLMNEMGYCQPEERCEICQSRIIQAEAVIREAIEKTIEEAQQIAALHECKDEDWPNCIDHACGEVIAAAIRSLKQSNSGMEVD